MLRFSIAISILMAVIMEAVAEDKAYYGETPPSNAIILPGYSIESVRARLEASPLQPIEGIWNYPEEMMTVGIERFSSAQFSKKIKYRIVLLDAEDVSLLPGTVIGYVAESVDNKKFKLWLYSQYNGMDLLGPQQCTASLTDGTLTFSPKKINIKLRINFARFLPTLFKGVSVIPEIKSEPLPVGFRRVYPSTDFNGSVNNEIRYL